MRFLPTQHSHSRSILLAPTLLTPSPSLCSFSPATPVLPQLYGISAFVPYLPPCGFGLPAVPFLDRTHLCVSASFLLAFDCPAAVHPAANNSRCENAPRYILSFCNFTTDLIVQTADTPSPRCTGGSPIQVIDPSRPVSSVRRALHRHHVALKVGTHRHARGGRKRRLLPVSTRADCHALPLPPFAAGYLAKPSRCVSRDAYGRVPGPRRQSPAPLTFRAISPSPLRSTSSWTPR